jgi:hypothetical protein
MQKDWIMENIENIMLGIEIAGLVMVGSIFVFYFLMKKKAKQKREQERD